jgi:uncharacterized membrane protein
MHFPIDFYDQALFIIIHFVINFPYFCLFICFKNKSAKFCLHTFKLLNESYIPKYYRENNKITNSTKTNSTKTHMPISLTTKKKSQKAVKLYNFQQNLVVEQLNGKCYRYFYVGDAQYIKCKAPQCARQ